MLDRALRLGDEEGLKAMTIRRLARELDVTPMALYWHFSSKEHLLLGVVDHVTTGVGPGGGDPWKRLRTMVESLVTVMREHAVLPELLHAVDRGRAAGFVRLTEDALGLLCSVGYPLREGYWVATFLLNSTIELALSRPDHPATMPVADAAEGRRQRRLELERPPLADYPMLVASAHTRAEEPGPERYFRFGIDLLIAAVEANTPARRASRAG